jgi:hypothetical protein
MLTEVCRNDFERAFLDIRPENFTREGLDCLFDYFTTLEEIDGEQMVLDVIAVCCAYTEYKDLAEFHNDHDKEDYPDIEAIEGRTTVVNIGGGGFIIEAF